MRQKPRVSKLKLGIQDFAGVQQLLQGCVQGWGVESFKMAGVVEVGTYKVIIILFYKILSQLIHGFPVISGQ